MLNKTQRIVEFGQYNGKPIEWLVVEEDGNQMVLLAKECITEMAFGEDNDYKKSDIRKFCLELENTAFAAEEQSALIAHEELQDKVFILSKDETDSLTFKDRIADDWYWLRSPMPSYYGNAIFVYSGGIGSYAYTYYPYGGVRPAVCIQQSYYHKSK